MVSATFFEEFQSIGNLRLDSHFGKVVLVRETCSVFRVFLGEFFEFPLHPAGCTEW